MKKLILIIFFVYILFLPSNATASSAGNKNFVDRFYLNYATSEQYWKDMPGVQYLSLTNGQPYLEFNPKVDVLTHSGSVGMQLGDGWFPFFGSTNSRIELGASYEKGNDKAQFHRPILTNGPVVPSLDGSGTVASGDTSGLVDSLTSFTFKRLEREYFIQYKADYLLKSHLRISPLIGLNYKSLDQSYNMFLSSPAVFAQRAFREAIDGKAYGAYAGLELEKTVFNNLSLFVLGKTGFDYQDNALSVREYDLNFTGIVSFETSDKHFSWNNSLEGGIRTNIWNLSTELSGGIEAISDMPQVVNPIKLGQPAARLDSDFAYNWFLKIAFSYDFN